MGEKEERLIVLEVERVEVDKVREAREKDYEMLSVCDNEELTLRKGVLVDEHKDAET